ncbi:MAG: ABC transporter ATP-binding protein [Patescibacteria group bacterium]
MFKKPHRNGNPFVYLFWKTWHYSAGNRKSVALYWGFFIIAISIMLFFLPLLGAKIMNEIQAEGITVDSMPTLIKLLVWMFVTKMVFWAFHGPARVWETLNAFKSRANYRKYLLKGTMTLPLEWHVEHHSGDTIDKIEKGASALYQFSSMSFQIVYAFIQLVGSFIMLGYFFPMSIPIVVGMMCLSIFFTIKFDRVMIPQYRKLNKAENEISENVFDTISNIATVIILRVERLVFEAICHRVDKPYDLFKRNTTLNEIKWFLTTFCTAAMTMLVLGLYVWQHMETPKAVLVGTVYILIKYLDEMSEVFFRFTGMYKDVVVGTSRIANAEEVADDFKEDNLANHVLRKDWQRMEVRDLNFSYADNGTGLHLANVAFDITRGSRVALVGASGSGKSTLLKVVRGLHRPQSLKLFVDDHEIEDGFDGICRAIGLLPQDPDIFGTTVIENITLGAEYDSDLVRRYTDMACFTDVAALLPKGLDSSLKERGVNLSGGQKQRLALARGLLACHDKEVVLLDEPTSSLDTATEKKVYTNIFNAFLDKTVISSIHRLHLLHMFDVIHFFHEGQLVATGTLAQLIRTCPEFLVLWQQYNTQPTEVVG